MTKVLDKPAVATLMPTGRYEWERIVRRIVMPPQHKLVALLLATWSDPDGSRVRPGMALLAASMGRSERTVSDVMRSLCRDWGLLEQVTRGGGRGGRGKAADYRLTIPTDLLDRHQLLGPDGQPDSSEPWASGHSEVSSETQTSGQSVESPVDNSDSSEATTSGQSNGHALIDRKSDAVTERLTGSFERLTGSPALPTTNHLTNHLRDQHLDHLPTQPPDARDEPVDKPRSLDDWLPLSKPPKPPPGPRCPHNLAPGTRDDGQPRCPACRRGLPATPNGAT